MDYEVNPIVKNQPFAGHPRRSGDRSMADTASASLPYRRIKGRSDLVA